MFLGLRTKSQGQQYRKSWTFRHNAEFWGHHTPPTPPQQKCAGETYPDGIFKSRDITLPTKVRLVKAMVFPVVMYGCESWTVKKAEH